MAEIVANCRVGIIPATVVAVISPTSDSLAVTAARGLGVPVRIVPYGDQYDSDLLHSLGDCDLVCLAGYLRLVPEAVLNAFPSRILNIHPSLLPRHGGKGMYGNRVHEAVLAAGDRVSGCTVHLVGPRYDEGSVVLQAEVPVLPNDTPETLGARVLAAEHRTYPAAIVKVLQRLAEPPGQGLE